MKMDNIRLFAKKKKKKKKQQLETLVQAVRIYSQDMDMEFGMEKWPMLIMRSGKRHMTKGIELLYQAKIWTLGEKESCKYLGILDADTIKQG